MNLECFQSICYDKKDWLKVSIDFLFIDVIYSLSGNILPLRTPLKSRSSTFDYELMSRPKWFPHQRVISWNKYDLRARRGWLSIADHVLCSSSNWSWIRRWRRDFWWERYPNSMWNSVEIYTSHTVEVHMQTDVSLVPNIISGRRELSIQMLHNNMSMVYNGIIWIWLYLWKREPHNSLRLARF